MSFFVFFFNEICGIRLGFSEIFCVPFVLGSALSGLIYRIQDLQMTELFYLNYSFVDFDHYFPSFAVIRMKKSLPKGHL